MQEKDKRTGKIGEHRYPELLQMIADGKTAPEIADALNVNQETVRKFARKRGLSIVRHDADPQRHPCWKGGTTTDKHGYILERVERDGPFGYLIRTARRTDPRGYALQHRIAMHRKLGRALRPEEVVHHIDGDVTNNDPANLQVFDTNADHLRETLKGQVPNWTPEGRARILEGVRRPRKNHGAIATP